jgi:hypothetical protein
MIHHSTGCCKHAKTITNFFLKSINTFSKCHALCYDRFLNDTVQQC